MKEVFTSFSYNTIDDVVRSVKHGSYMCTVDIQSAYRSVAIHPQDRKYFGLSWDFNDGNGNVHLTDNFMCFGGRPAPFLFNRLSDAVSRFMQREGFCCFNYLDDFIIVADNQDACLKGQYLLIRTLRDLGFYIAWDKTSYPSLSRH